MSKKLSLQEATDKAIKSFNKIHLDSDAKNYDRELELYIFIDNVLSYSKKLTRKQISELQAKLDKSINHNLPF